MKRAFVTGATGTVGTALIKELINNSIEVLVLLTGRFCTESEYPCQSACSYNVLRFNGIIPLYPPDTE